MSDIDFDELDKAVNSLMQSNNLNKQTQDKQPEPKPVLEQEKPQQDDNSKADDLNATPETKTSGGDILDMSMIDSIGVGDSPNVEISEPAATTATPRQAPVVPERPSVATRSRGQFMDVMHHSANMKPSAEAAAQAPASPISREGISLQSGLESKPSDQPALQTDQQAEVSDRGVEQSTPTEAVSNESIEPAKPQVVEHTGSADPYDLSSVEKAASSFAESMQETAVDASSSPFLPDAKVEKRPLGAVDMQEQQAPEEVPQTEAVNHEPEVNFEVSEGELPREFDANLVSLESDGTEQVAALENRPPIEPPKIDPSAYDLVQSDSQSDSTTNGQFSAVAAAPVTASPALPSRTPTESVDNFLDDEAHSSIFETATQDELRAPGRHTSSWYTVVIFAGMVMIGVLCAVVYYFITSGA